MNSGSLSGLLPGLTARAADPRPVVRVGDAHLSAAHLLDAADRLAERIRGCPMAALGATTSLETIVAVLGCLTAGVPLVPVPPDSGPAEVAYMLRDSQARLWLGALTPAAASLSAADGLPGEQVPVDLTAWGTAGSGGHRTSAERVEPGIEPAPGATALVMYTSGTTGAPKGVILSRRAIMAGIDGLADAWAWTADDVLVHGLPLFHVHGLILGVLGPLRLGGSLVHPGSPRPEGYAAAAQAHSGSLFFAVPTIWGRIAADPSCARALSGARLLVSGSAALPSGVATTLATLTGQMPVERYGMTETLITIAARADEPRRVGWVGRPISDVEARVLDEAGTPVPLDAETLGDLQVRGRTQFDGYLGRAEESAASWTEDGWFRTGDVAVRDEHGWYRIVGRKSSDLIKSGGYRIGAGEIESSLLDHPGVAEAAVVGVADDDLGQRIVAFVVPTAATSTPVTTQELINHVAQQLSAHKRPRQIRFVESLPRNEMGKVQKTRLL